MDEGEIELSDPVFLPNSGTSNNNNNTLRGGSTSVDSFLDEFLKHTKTCTHTHTCNPPGPDAAHTHTCYHTHTQVFSSDQDTKNRRATSNLKSRRPLGNREAVRKYREKKKAHTAYLEEEVKKLRLMNQHLVRKLQGQGVLEAELLRLRALLVDLRGKIDVELGSFPFQKHCSNNNTNVRLKEGDCGIGLQCQAEIPCFHPQGNQSVTSSDGVVVDKAVFSWQENCQPAIVDCRVSGNGLVGASDDPIEDVGTLVSAKIQGQ